MSRFALVAKQLPRPRFESLIKLTNDRGGAFSWTHIVEVAPLAEEQCNKFLAIWKRTRCPRGTSSSPSEAESPAAPGEAAPERVLVPLRKVTKTVHAQVAKIDDVLLALKEAVLDDKMNQEKDDLIKALCADGKLLTKATKMEESDEDEEDDEPWTLAPVTKVHQPTKARGAEARS